MKLNGNAFSNWNYLCDNGKGMEKGNGKEEWEWNSVRQSSEISVGFRLVFFFYLWSVNAAGIARQGPARPGPTKTVKWITVSRSVQRRRGLMNIKQQAQCDDRSIDRVIR